MEYHEDLDARFKTAVPRVYHKVLLRGDIANIIVNTSLNEAVCIVAPYGCGKTLAVISWLRVCGLQAAWLSLDETHNSEAALLARLTSAILSFTGEWERDFVADSEYLENPKTFLWDAVLRVQGDNLEKVLVIDNFRFIRDAELLRFIREFIYTLLGTWRVIIISRIQLPPVFNDLMLKGHIRLITIEKLSFSPEEMADYFKMNGFDIPQQDIIQMRNETEGWPAALNVISTVCHGGAADYGEAARDYVMGFFETEIWDSLDEDIKDFLLKTSVLTTLTPSACHAVTDVGATLPTLKWLYLNGLFISKLGERDAYRYHCVFRDFLTYMLSASDLDERALYKKFAWWLYERNEMEQSFTYFFKVGDLYGVSQALKILNPANIGIESFLELTSCITTSDIMDLKPYPVIVARMALIHYLTGNVTEMQKLYHNLIEWNDPGVLPVSPEDYAEYMWEVGWLCYLNPTEEVRNNRKHEEWTNYREYVPHLRSLHVSRGAVLRFPTVLRGIRDYCSVVYDLEPFMKQAEETGQSTVREEVSTWEMNLILAEHAYETENFTKAEEIIRRIMTITEDQQFTDLYFICTALLVKVTRAIHNPKEIDTLTTRLETMIMNNKDYFLLPNFRAFELRNRLAAGQAGLTDVFEKENVKDKDKPYFYLLYRHITLVRGLLSTGEYSEAMLILGNLELLCQKYKRTMDLIEVNILKSIAIYSLGYEDGASRCLTEALKEAKKYGYIRIFSDDAKDLWPILPLVKKQMTDKFTQKIIISCKKALTRVGYKFSKKKYSHIELTKTEIKILKSLKAGMSYMEIALDNDIKMSTVKTHVSSVYSKLGVDNKTSAVMAAQEQGILEP